MGTIEIVASDKALLKAAIFIYGSEATDELCKLMVEEVETLWNEAQGKMRIGAQLFALQFEISGKCEHHLTPQTVLENKNPQNNYFRIEAFVNGNISFVDAVNSNTGMFKLENLYAGSTTAAHEFGHTIGLAHPHNLDLRGKGLPGLMYPRGTIVDAQYQYDPNAIAGQPGGTMHPKYRKVWKEEVAMLTINHKYSINDHTWVIGTFTNTWHEPHDMFA